MYVGRYYEGGGTGDAQKYRHYISGGTANYHVNTSDTSGKIRLKRVGQSWEAFYWSGSSWTSFGSPEDVGNSDDCTIYIQLYAYNNLNVGGTFDNFTLAKGSITSLTTSSTTTTTTTTSSSTASTASTASTTSTSTTSSSTTSSSTTTTVTGTVFYDDFTGTNGDDVDQDYWYPSGAQAEIQNNKFNVTIVGDVVGQGATTRFTLDDDFDIKVDFDLPQHPSTDFWLAQLSITEVDSSVSADLQRLYRTTGGDAYRGNWDDGTGFGFGSPSSRDDLTGKLRIARVGKDWTWYAWYSSQWNIIRGPETQVPAAGKVTVRIEMRNGNNDPTA